MSEIHRRVIARQVDEWCDDCRQGYMRPTGTTFGAGVVQHACSACGRLESYEREYPYIEHLVDPEART